MRRPISAKAIKALLLGLTRNFWSSGEEVFVLAGANGSAVRKSAGQIDGGEADADDAGADGLVIMHVVLVVVGPPVSKQQSDGAIVRQALLGPERTTKAFSWSLCPSANLLPSLMS